MTLIDAKEAELVIGGPAGLVELPVEDKPPCPSCNAEPALQMTSVREPDGALEIVVRLRRLRQGSPRLVLRSLGGNVVVGTRSERYACPTNRASA